MMAVRSDVIVYEVDGEEVLGAPTEYLRVLSAFLSGRIQLEYRGKRITVLASDLKKAIENATNI